MNQAVSPINGVAPPTGGYQPPRVAGRAFLSKRLVADISDAWAQFGEGALKIVAKRSPEKFLQLAFGILPKDVLVSVVEQRRPGNLSAEDWEAMLRVLELVKANVPAGASAAPAEVFGVIENALRSHYATPVDRGDRDGGW